VALLIRGGCTPLGWLTTAAPAGCEAVPVALSVRGVCCSVSRPDGDWQLAVLHCVSARRRHRLLIAIARSIRVRVNDHVA